MTKRSLDIPATTGSAERMPPAKAQKTERSHEENQERAYIAASRRADRSLEARVQSARMASEIHRRRTGRGLKVTEEIVVKEEMYEEEEDDLPRQYKYLAAHLQTNSPDMNSRVSAYITTQAAMATMARYNEVNRLFSESFPSALAYQQQLNNSAYMAPFLNNAGNNPANNTVNNNTPVSNSYQPRPSPPMPSPSTRTSSIAAPSQTSRTTKRSSISSKPTKKPSTVSSPPPLSPGSTTHTSESRSTPIQTPAQTFMPLDPQLQTSSFTSQLPNEIKMMGNIDMNDPMAPYFFGGNPSSLQMFGYSPEEDLKFNFNEDSAATPTAADINDLQSPVSLGEQNDESLYSPVDAFDGHLDFNQMGTPSNGGGVNDGGWESFVDFGTEH